MRFHLTQDEKTPKSQYDLVMEVVQEAGEVTLPLQVSADRQIVCRTVICSSTIRAWVPLAFFCCGVYFWEVQETT